jgi:hypothetical protein
MCFMQLTLCLVVLELWGMTGAVLTAFVGVDGLLYQLAVDGCMPAFLMRKNKCVLCVGFSVLVWWGAGLKRLGCLWSAPRRLRNTNHFIILIFLGLSILLVLVMKGVVTDLAGAFPRRPGGTPVPWKTWCRAQESGSSCLGADGDKLGSSKHRHVVTCLASPGPSTGVELHIMKYHN